MNRTKTVIDSTKTGIDRTKTGIDSTKTGTDRTKTGISYGFRSNTTPSTAQYARIGLDT
jgi:hypothetical protein